MKGCEAEEACTLPGISAANQRVLLHRARVRKPPDDTLPARRGPLRWGRGPTIGRRRCAVAAGGSGAIPLTQPARCRRHLARDGRRRPLWYRPVVALRPGFSADAVREGAEGGVWSRRGDAAAHLRLTAIR
jgi:hypothetical protein